MRAVRAVMVVIAGCYSDPDYAVTQFRCDDGHLCPADQICECGLCLSEDATLQPTSLANFPVSGATTMTEPVCDADNALASDGIPAGLPWSSNTMTVDAAIESVLVTSCLAAQFPSTMDAGCIRLRWTRGNACGGTCSGTTSGESNCDGPATAPIFTADGATVTSAEMAMLPSMTAQFGDLFIPLEQPADRVIVCRGSWGSARADVLVDSINVFAASP